MNRNVYVASSWRNDEQPLVVAALRAAGHGVYDFKKTLPGDSGFHWSEIDPNWEKWDSKEYQQALTSPIAASGFKSDWDAMVWADSCVLVMPCGRSAHIEAGYFVGTGKRLVIILSSGEPELMYLMADVLVDSISEAVEAISAG